MKSETRNLEPRNYCMPACLFVSFSACLPICLYVCLSVCLSAHLSLCLSACFPVCLSMFVFLSACMSASLFVFPACLSCLPVCGARVCVCVVCSAAVLSFMNFRNPKTNPRLSVFPIISTHALSWWLGAFYSMLRKCVSFWSHVKKS